MYEDFTEHALRVLVLAEQEARRFNHEYVGTEHLLLGLVRHAGGKVVALLKDLGVDPRAIRLAIEKLIQSGPDPVTAGKLPMTPRARTVLAFAAEEAGRLPEHRIGTEHLLLGLLREEEGVAAQILMNSGLTLEQVRKRLNARSAESSPAGSAGASGVAGASRVAGTDRSEAPALVRLKLTDGVRRAMRLASEEAKRNDDEYIGTLHLLSGILDEDENTAVELFKALGLDLERLRGDLAKTICRHREPASAGDRLPSYPAKLVMYYAEDEACALEHKHFGVEHVLLGFLREGKSAAAGLLLNLGLTLERMREAVRAMPAASPSQSRPEQRRSFSAGQNTVTSMYERFTDGARKVMQLANQEAQRFNHEYIGTEHVLLGLVMLRSGTAARVLKNLGVDLRKPRLEVEKLVQSGPDMVISGKLPQTPRAKKVIEFSMQEARNLNHSYVGTEHILLGLLREQEGVAARVLMNLGLSLATVRAETLNVLGQGEKG